MTRSIVTPLLAPVLLLGGCSHAAREDTNYVVQELTTEGRVLGFEGAADWNASVGTKSASGVRAQLSSSLGIRNFTGDYTELTTPNLPTLSNVTSTLALNIKPPATPIWGQVSLYISIPSRDIHNQPIGTASIAGLPAGDFHELEFHLTSQVVSTLQQSYSDLTIKIVLNAPTSDQDYLLDHLRFEGGSSCETTAYTLVASAEDPLDDEIFETMRCTFFDVYPGLVQYFNPSSPTFVRLEFGPTGVGSASNDVITFGIAHLEATGGDYGAMVHEATHVVQHYVQPGTPGWLTEGIADWARDEFGAEYETGDWSIPTSYAYGQHYLQGGGTVASFMNWMRTTYKEPALVQDLDDILRAGDYDDDTLGTLTGTGLGVGELWLAYSGGTAPQPDAQGVTLYEGENFTGWSFRIAPSIYDLVDLEARGLLNDTISSIDVPAGFSMTIYEHDGLGGAEAEITSDVANLDSLGFNNTISSVVVE